MLTNYTNFNLDSTREVADEDKLGYESHEIFSCSKRQNTYIALICNSFISLLIRQTDIKYKIAKIKIK